MRIALVSREMYPLAEGGIAQYVSSAARLLSSLAEVTILTNSRYEDAYRRLREADDPRLPPDDVRVVFVQEPSYDEASVWLHSMHCYSARVYERLQEVFPGSAPELIEFADYLGEGFVTLQARETLDPFLARSTICVRIHTASEICQVLDGYLTRDPGSQALFAMERYSLLRADRLLWQGGDVLGAYQRFYGAESLAPAERIRYPYVGPSAQLGDASHYRVGEPLRLLYIGRLERRKGIHHLIRAVSSLDRDDFRVTVVGADTHTGPLGVSMHEQLRLTIGADDRVELRAPVERNDVIGMIDAHDVVVVPSLWECWPYVALESLHRNRPILGTPVGGLLELVNPGMSGWLAKGTDVESLATAVENLVEERSQLEARVRNRLPAAHARAMSEPSQILQGYKELLARRIMPAAARTHRRVEPPLVSAVVPYFRSSAFVRDTVESLLAQTYPRVEILLINDGSFDEEDWVVEEIAQEAPVSVFCQLNAGLGAARNFGILQSSGRYFFPLDADNIVHPEFIARCVAVLEQRPEVAYVTSWSRYINADGEPWEGQDLGYEPLGNRASVNAQYNVAGDAAAVIRRHLFDIGFRYSEELTSYEDWELYRELANAGHYGAIIPARLLHYRVREDSLQSRFGIPQRERLLDEMAARLREREVQWTS